MDESLRQYTRTHINEKEWRDSDRILYVISQPQYPVFINTSITPLSVYLSCILYANTSSSTYDSNEEERCKNVIGRLRDDKYPYLDDIRITFRPTHEVLLPPPPSPTMLYSINTKEDLPIMDNGLTSTNQQCNEKSVMLNLVSMEMMLALSRESFSKWCFDKFDYSYSRFVSAHPDVFTPTIIRDPFPCSSILFDCFGNIMHTLHDNISIFENGSYRCWEKKCRYCGLLYKLRPKNGIQGGLTIVSHFTKFCTISAVCGRYDDVKRKVVYILESDILDKRIDEFDATVLACNEFVRGYGIIEKLRADFPFLPFPETYSDCLFYSDGSSYRTRNGEQPSSTEERAKLLYHYYNDLREILAPIIQND
jgi:hypothetical protein